MLMASMEHDEHLRGRRTPAWVWAVCIAVAAVDPLTHLWIAHGLPEGSVPTGLHSGDSHMYLTAMEAGHNGWYSPYASAAAPSHDPAYFNVPTHRVYAVLGWATAAVGVDSFMALGLLNGLCAFLYLVAAYFFLRAIAPRLCGLAFFLFAFGGGLGGPIYIVAYFVGATDGAGFETWFDRHAAYDLIEGAHLWPMLHGPRLYYTLSMACILFALTIMVRPNPVAWRVALAVVLAFVGQMINMRAGTFLWGMGTIYFLLLDRPLRERIFASGVLAVPVMLGGLLTLRAIAEHPSYTANVYGGIGETILFSALLSGIGVHLVIARREWVRGVRGLTGPLRWVAMGVAGYLFTWIVLYAGYQIYYGNYLHWGDVTSAIVVSDWALIGVALGLVGARWVPAQNDDGRLDDVRWAVLWIGLVVTVGISAWGQGAFMSLLPRRLLVVVGMPLCLVTASAIVRMGARHPLRGRMALGVLLVCGVSSSAVGALIFQGPNRTPGEGPFARIHYESMTTHDATLLDSLGEGRVLSPMFNPITFGDVIARHDHGVVGAVGTLNHSDRPFEETKNAVNAFFATDTREDVRAAFLRQEEVAYVYCPDTCPVTPRVIDALDSMPGLERIAEAGRGVVYRVDLENDVP